MAEVQGLSAGTQLKEIATRDHVWHNCAVVRSDLVGLVFEVQRTVTDGGDVENVVSHILVPWPNVNHIVLLEKRS
jgi:hypothetical protein